MTEYQELLERENISPHPPSQPLSVKSRKLRIAVTEKRRVTTQLTTTEGVTVASTAFASEKKRLKNLQEC